MISISSNIAKVVQVTIGKLHEAAATDRMVRNCATSVLGMMKKRVHEDGLDSTGRQIGTYSKSYMAVRTGSFTNAKKNKKTGALKDAGVFTKKSANAGKARPKYNRSADPKVVLSLTRQMENDMKVIATRSGAYGIGYSNKHNYDKSQWNEKRYGAKIFALSASEHEAVAAIIKKHTADAFS